MKHFSNLPVLIRIASTPEHLPIVRAALLKMCQQMELPDETTDAVSLSLDEALANVIKHAYKGQAGKPIEIEMGLCDGTHGRLCIRIRDWGAWTDPSQIRSRDLADVRPGGLGVHIMHQCMDSVEYKQADGGGTMLTMVKNLQHRPENATHGQ